MKDLKLDSLLAEGLSLFRKTSKDVQNIDTSELRSLASKLGALTAGIGAQETVRRLRGDRSRENGALVAASAAAAAGGAALMYFCDPQHGSARRTAARDRIATMLRRYTAARGPQVQNGTGPAYPDPVRVRHADFGESATAR